MALTWTAKAPGSKYRYTWTPALADGDSVASFAAPTVSGATINSYTPDDDNLIVVVSGGTAGTTATFTLSATSDYGETLTETIYLPIVANTAGTTARDIVNFALRKITGLGTDPDASQEGDAVERLGDMLALWAMEGIAVNPPSPLTASTTLYLAADIVAAIKWNLCVYLAPLYGADALDPLTMQAAEASKRAVLNKVFANPDLVMDATLTGSTLTVADLF
jgi:hypothetical protein